MKTLAKILAAVLLSTVAVACGAPPDDTSSGSDDLTSANPISWAPHAQTVAGTVLHKPALIQIDGSTQPGVGFVWDFKFVGSDMTSWVTIRASSTRSAQLMEQHTSSGSIDGPGTIQLSKVKIKVSDLLSLAAKNGVTGTADNISLTQPLVVFQTPIWTLDAKGTIRVDANTGKVLGVSK